MVKKQPSVYIFIGQDSLAKDIQLTKLKTEFLSPQTQYFNLDVIYGKDSSLKELQEKLLCLPVEAKKRLLIVKDSQALKEDIKEFILNYVKNPNSHIILVLDINKYSSKDGFVSGISSFGEVLRFKEEAHIDTFALSRAIDFKKPAYALGVLSQLLKNGEKPERILGGLRYSWENSTADALAVRKKLQILLSCDIDIKTGRLKPDFALEKLVLNLCRLANPSG